MGAILVGLIAGCGDDDSTAGACFWDATMDLATGEILRVYFHGSG